MSTCHLILRWTLHTSRRPGPLQCGAHPKTVAGLRLIRRPHTSPGGAPTQPLGRTSKESLWHTHVMAARAPGIGSLAVPTTLHSFHSQRDPSKSTPAPLRPHYVHLAFGTRRASCDSGRALRRRAATCFAHSAGTSCTHSRPVRIASPCPALDVAAPPGARSHRAASYRTLPRNQHREGDGACELRSVGPYVCQRTHARANGGGAVGVTRAPHAAGAERSMLRGQVVGGVELV
ncbi:hypothetical protein FA95DRAFT_178497 [Auriscalpium vulgare]|uniref:Uncharacterized protein n=1 Tax=Auriscalpium vulgare TaxID=40419 RepID=A0ACB8RN35_9AGAM|nr:hypothetical protein FA95DRAFT_178497 [Auriscalpium vulgare]